MVFASVLPPAALLAALLLGARLECA